MYKRIGPGSRIDGSRSLETQEIEFIDNFLGEKRSYGMECLY